MIKIFVNITKEKEKEILPVSQNVPVKSSCLSPFWTEIETGRSHDCWLSFILFFYLQGNMDPKLSIKILRNLVTKRNVNNKNEARRLCVVILNETV